VSPPEPMQRTWCGAQARKAQGDEVMIIDFLIFAGGCGEAVRAEKRRGDFPCGRSPLLSEFVEDPARLPNHIYLPLRVCWKAASLTPPLSGHFRRGVRCKSFFEPPAVCGCPLAASRPVSRPQGSVARPLSEFRYRRSPWLPLPAATLESVAEFQLRMPFLVSARDSFPIPAASPVAGSRV
jgi:hypothetical protein